VKTHPKRNKEYKLKTAKCLEISRYVKGTLVAAGASSIAVAVQFRLSTVNLLLTTSTKYSFMKICCFQHLFVSVVLKL